MVGVTLAEIRAHVDRLASDDGDYYVVCGRTGDRPVPAAGKRFPDRGTARAAARATEQYRNALRRYDPQVPYYDLIVSEEAPSSAGPRPDTDATHAGGTRAGAAAGSDARGTERRRLVECCHRTAAAVFETLSADGYDAVETAVVDAYFDLAETLADPDDLCLCLLESVARELDARLSPTEQAAVVASAADRLPPPASTDRPVSATLGSLRDRGLLGRYTLTPWSVDLDAGTRSVVAGLSSYALSPHRGRLPVLPIVLDLYRRGPDWSPSAVRAGRAEPTDGWRVELVLAREATRDPDGLVSAPIGGDLPG